MYALSLGLFHTNSQSQAISAPHCNDKTNKMVLISCQDNTKSLFQDVFSVLHSVCFVFVT